MVQWYNNIQIILRHVGTGLQQRKMSSINFHGTYLKHFISSGPVPSCRRDFFLASRNAVEASYRYLQRLDISNSTKLLVEADSGLMPVSSPLTPVLPSLAGESVTSAVPKPSKVQAVLKGIRQSPKKVNLVAQLVRGMRVEDALLQLQVTVKRAAKTVYKVIKSARANASNNHGMDPDRLLVAEAFVGKGVYLKRLSYHAKGRCGVMVRPHCRLTVVVRELTAEEEAKIAKLKVMNYKKLTEQERRLVPHQLIEVTPRWSRRPRSQKPSQAET